MIGLALISMYLAAPAPHSTQVFEFKGIRAGEVVTQDKIAGCSNDDAQICFAKTDTNVAGSSVTTVDIGLYRGKLSTVTIWSDNYAFEQITDAFKAKYGKPCEAAIASWQSRIGRPVPNPTFTWCFATGKLRAQLHGFAFDVSVYEYHDINVTPDVKPKPKIDF